jgi:hypothetical protein
MPAALAFGIHLYAAGSYGIFRDELYFIVCGEHPDWGYVDQPPLIPLLAATTHLLAPDSLRTLRLVPILGHVATIMLTAATARTLGGSRFAQSLAGTCVLVGGVYLALGTILTTDALQSFAWLLCAYALIRLIRDGEQRWWWAIGTVAGVALLTKYTLAFWLIALAIGIVATPARRILLHREPWLAACIALAIVLPNVLWQAMHDWPFLVIGRVAVQSKNLPLSPLQFLLAEMQYLNVATAPIWVAGLIAFGVWHRFADLRLFAVAFLALFGALIAMHAKPYYAVGAYPVLFAGGAVAIETWLTWRPMRYTLVAVIALSGAVAAPFALPILPVATFIAYRDLLHQSSQPIEQGQLGELPQLYADMFGWRELAGQVGAIFRTLSPEDRAKAVFLAGNYGEAAAIDVLGDGTPPAISGHNNYFLWGPRGHDGSVVIRLGGERNALLRAYSSVEPADVFDHPLAMPYERHQTLWLCRGRRVSFDQDWASFRNYR